MNQHLKKLKKQYADIKKKKQEAEAIKELEQKIQEEQQPEWKKTANKLFKKLKHQMTK